MAAAEQDEMEEQESEGEKWSPFEHGEADHVESIEDQYPGASVPVLDLLRKIKGRTRAGQNHREALLQTFSGYDVNGSGELSLSEFHKALSTYLPRSERVTLQDAQQLLDFFDNDASGSISLEEFFRGMGGGRDPSKERGIAQESGEEAAQRAIKLIVGTLNRQTPPRAGLRELTEYVRHILATFDAEETGTLSLSEFKDAIHATCGRMLASSDTNIGDAEFEAVFNHFDDDGSGDLSIDELVEGLKGECSRVLKELQERDKELQEKLNGQGDGGDGNGTTKGGDSTSEVTADDISVSRMGPDHLVERLKRKYADAEQMQAAFEKFDVSADGILGPTEFEDALVNIVGSAVSSDAVEELLRRYDSDGNGELEVSELVEAMFRPSPSAADETGSTTSSRRSSRRSSLHSRASMSTARVDIPAAAVWEALKSHVQLVGAQQFDPQRFEAELEESAGGGNLNYLTKQRVQIAAQKLLGQDIAMEFEGLSSY